MGNTRSATALFTMSASSVSLAVCIGFDQYTPWVLRTYACIQIASVVVCLWLSCQCNTAIYVGLTLCLTHLFMNSVCFLRHEFCLTTNKTPQQPKQGPQGHYRGGFPGGAQGFPTGTRAAPQGRASCGIALQARALDGSLSAELPLSKLHLTIQLTDRCNIKPSCCLDAAG